MISYIWSCGWFKSLLFPPPFSSSSSSSWSSISEFLSLARWSFLNSLSSIGLFYLSSFIPSSSYIFTGKYCYRSLLYLDKCLIIISPMIEKTNMIARNIDKLYRTSMNQSYQDWWEFFPLLLLSLGQYPSWITEIGSWCCGLEIWGPRPCSSWFQTLPPILLELRLPELLLSSEE